MEQTYDDWWKRRRFLDIGGTFIEVRAKNGEYSMYYCIPGHYNNATCYNVVNLTSPNNINKLNYAAGPLEITQYIYNPEDSIKIVFDHNPEKLFKMLNLRNVV